MKTKHFTRSMTMTFLATILLSGCISFSTLQSVETLDPGTVSFSGGMSILGTEEDNFGALPELGMRVGLTNRVDVGAKLFLPLAVFVDAKIELIQRPITVSLDLGYSTFTLRSGTGETKNQTNGFYPMLMAGQKHWYVGVKPMIIQTEGELNLFGSSTTYTAATWFATDLVMGAVIGNRFRILPEVNLLFSPDLENMILIPALGVELHF